jgi:hypothetical protein
MIVFGSLPALVFTIVRTAQPFEIKKECKGAFNSAFSSGFDIRRCDLVIRHVPTGREMRFPLHPA